jgi:hypothetical protein
MFIIPRHDGKSNGMASAAQRHISQPPIANSACVASILNLGDHFAGPCTSEMKVWIGFIRLETVTGGRLL